MKKFFRTTSMAIAVMAMMIGLALQSCGSKSTGSVPADATFVATFNFNSLIENAGGNVDGEGNITLPTDILPASQAAMLQMASSMISPFDLSDVIVYSRDANYSSHFVAVIKLRDQAAAEDKLKMIVSEPQSKSGYQVYTSDYGVFAVKDNVLYFGENLDDIDNGIKAAAKKSFEANGSINDFISASKTFALAINPGKNLPSNYYGNWICGNINFENQSMTGEAVLMNVDGKRVDFGTAFGVISTDFLRYIPSNAQNVIALGPINNPTLKNVLSMAAGRAGEFAPAIAGLDGTIALSLSATEDWKYDEFLREMQQGNINLEDLNIFLMAHYSQSELPKVMDILKVAFGQLGSITTQGDINTVDYKGKPVYFGSADSYAIVSNSPINANSENPYNPLIEGRRIAIASIQQPGQNPYGFEFGQQASLWLDSDAVKFNATFTNTDKPFMAVMIEILKNPEVQAQILEAIQNMQKIDYSFGGYDPDEDFSVSI